APRRVASTAEAAEIRVSGRAPAGRRERFVAAFAARFPDSLATGFPPAPVRTTAALRLQPGPRLRHCGAGPINTGKVPAGGCPFPLPWAEWAVRRLDIRGS